MSVKFDVLQQKTTPDAVHDVLRAAILEGTLAPGAPLREARIAVDMGISRAPIREALSKLEEDGLVVKVAFRGSFVAEVSAATIAEIASLRMLLEPYAVELSLPAIKDGHRQQMLDNVSALYAAVDAGDIPASIDHHLAFHGLFYELSGHDLMKSMWTGWESKLRLFLVADHKSFNDLQDIGRDHERLADLILAEPTDVGSIRRELARHIHAAPGASISSQITAPSDAVARITTS